MIYLFISQLYVKIAISMIILYVNAIVLFKKDKIMFITISQFGFYNKNSHRILTDKKKKHILINMENYINN